MGAVGAVVGQVAGIGSGLLGAGANQRAQDDAVARDNFYRQDENLRQKQAANYNNADKFSSAAAGLFGAKQNAAVLNRAAVAEMEQANYNASITRYTGEVAAQEAKYNAEAKIQALAAEKENIGRNAGYQQGSMLQEGANEAAQSRVRIAASGVDNPMAQQAIVEEAWKNFMGRQHIQAQANYQQQLSDYSANEIAKNSINTQNNIRQGALWQSANIIGQGSAKAGQYNASAGSLITSSLLEGSVTALQTAPSLMLATSPNQMGGAYANAGLGLAKVGMSLFDQPHTQTSTSSPYSSTGNLGAISGANAGMGSPSLFGGSNTL